MKTGVVIVLGKRTYNVTIRFEAMDFSTYCDRWDFTPAPGPIFRGRIVPISNGYAHYPSTTARDSYLQWTCRLNC